MNYNNTCDDCKKPATFRIVATIAIDNEFAGITRCDDHLAQGAHGYIAGATQNAVTIVRICA